jgi:hypothetical protein
MNKERTMKRTISLILAGLLAVPAMSMAGDVLKCVDTAGRVTLTDRPCESGSSSTRLEQDGSAAYGGSGSTGSSGASEPELPLAASAPARQRYVLPAADLRQAAWKRSAADRPAALARDIATLKEARRMQLIQETPRHSLAGIN